MNDYLWDRSGEPDPELEQMEALLRPLRYASPAGGLVLPKLSAAPAKRRIPAWGWAIAASVAFLALTFGIWLVHQTPAESLSMALLGDVPVRDLGWSIPTETAVGSGPVDTNDVAENMAARRRRNFEAQAAQNAARLRAEDREGRMAAEQLLKALRITSDQLNIVKTKVRPTDAGTPES